MSRTAIALAIVSMVTAIAAAQGPPLPSERQIHFSSDISVPMLDAGGRPVVELSINGHGPYRFIVDTGANMIVVADDLIAELQLQSINGAAGEGPVRIDKLAIDALTISDVTAIRGGPMLAGLGSQARGVLSAESFPGSLIIFDFPKQRFMLRRGELPAPDGRRVFEYESDDPLPRVPIRIDGTELHLHIDTGAPTSMSLPLARAKTLGLEDKLVERGRARVVTGVFPVYEAPFTGKVELGEFVLPVPAISFSDLRPGPAPPPGLIGMKLLRDFVMTVDAKRRRVRFERPQ